MFKPNLCLCLTGKTIAEDLELVRQYRPYIDMVELRADFLTESERLNIQRFPQHCDLPAILTIRRKSDGGLYTEGEGSRAMLFALALSHSAANTTEQNFAFVDFEEDFRVSSLEDAALAFGTRIIRSFHDMNGPVSDIKGKLQDLQVSGFEIPKIAFKANSLDDVTALFKQTKNLEPGQQIFCVMGPYAAPARILAQRLNSFLSFCSIKSKELEMLGHIDPVTMQEVYRFKEIDSETKIFGITGFPLTATSSPMLHNKAYAKTGLNAVFVPFKAEEASQAVRFAKELDLQGFSVTIPHKEKIIGHLNEISDTVREIHACNTVVCGEDNWFGHNTDAPGFQRALAEFADEKFVRRSKVAIIGAGGAAKAVAYAVHAMGAKACVFNRTLSKAKELAERFGFRYAELSRDSAKLLAEYSAIIIQTTSKGMGSEEPSSESNDPIHFYEFKGHEKLFDIIYVPEVTPVMARAKQSGCVVCNGYKMLRYQGERQFELYTGIETELE